MADLVRLAFCCLHRTIGSPRTRAQNTTRHQPALVAQDRRVPQASGAGFSSLAIRTGSVRSDSRTFVPAVIAPTADVGSCASTVTSPRSTLTRLVAPRNTVDMTLPVNGPGLMSPSETTDTASGRTSAMAGPSVESGFTRGKRVPRTSTSPPLTTPARRFVRPTNSATNGVGLGERGEAGGGGERGSSRERARAGGAADRRARLEVVGGADRGLFRA